MNLNIPTDPHMVLHAILSARGMTEPEQGLPLWKYRLTATEYDQLRHTLQANAEQLDSYCLEAAMCYAEWWHRDYRGSVPSKEDVAVGIGLGAGSAEPLFNAAVSALKKYNYSFIHSPKRTEYFRTLLNQGGLPVKYIKDTDKSFSSFTLFLKGLVRELSAINYDWNSDDISIIEQFNCISYLSKTYRNDNIYDVAFQIAHAIIKNDHDLLPYDDNDNDASLKELTKSLENDYIASKREKRIRPLSLHWKMCLENDGIGQLYMNMNVVKEISSDSISGLDYASCYAFDILVAGRLVGKYVRKELMHDEAGDPKCAVYARVSTGMIKDILWQGEQVVEVKVRCDNEDRLFPTVAGSYSPNFDVPQVFQLLDNNVYAKGQTGNSEENIVVFSKDWHAANEEEIVIRDRKLGLVRFSDSVSLCNGITGEKVTLTNEFTPYSVEYSQSYISWIEDSNYKLITNTPIIRVYDKDKEIVNNAKTYFRPLIGTDCQWRELKRNTSLPLGIVDIKVEFPDHHYEIERFYNIRGMRFVSRNEGLYSTEIVCTCDPGLKPIAEATDNLEIEKIGFNSWRISKKEGVKVCPSECAFRIYGKDQPNLRISIAIPFDGMRLLHVDGSEITDRRVIPLGDLPHYRIVSHGKKHRKIKISYTTEKVEDRAEIKQLNGRIISGIVPLSDYYDLIVRMFNLYGVNSFDRTSSVVLNIHGHEVFVRRFVLEANIDGDSVRVDDLLGQTESNYDGTLYAVSVEEPITAECLKPVELIRDEEKANLFHFPGDFGYNEVIVFSGAEYPRRIIPKYFNRNDGEQDKKWRDEHTKQVIPAWTEKLKKEDVLMGEAWKSVCVAFEMCSRHHLPFSTIDAFKAIRNHPDLMVKLILAMWLNNSGEILMQDIEEFEQEMVTALHWIPRSVWDKSIMELIDNSPAPLRSRLSDSLSAFFELLRNLLFSTLSMDEAQDLSIYISSGRIGEGTKISKQEINDFNSTISGVDDANHDLPILWHCIKGSYYHKCDMLDYYRVMLKSAICAAENNGEVDGATDLFSERFKDNGRIINFYRRYFKETYSKIFMRALKIIKNPKK